MTYHRSCSKIVRKFYDDFDRLPRVFKEFLWSNPSSPSFDDLKAAWLLAEENLSIPPDLNVFEQERKAANKRAADLAREQRRYERNSKWDSKWRRRASHHLVPVYRVVRPKDQKLIDVVTAEKAFNMLSRRAETDDIKPAGPLRILVGFKKVETQPEEKLVKPEPMVHLSKALHNAGGK